MSRAHLLQLTGRERTFGADEIIVSKTDTKGRITYANEVFLKISGYTEAELLGKAHSIIRHPEMPRCVFKFLWDTISAGQEIFAYVINRAKNGDHYWVFAHVTPTFDAHDRIVSYHSNRRTASRAGVARIRDIYAALLEIERRHDNPRDAWNASLPVLVKQLQDLGTTYEEFIFTLAA